MANDLKNIKEELQEIQDPEKAKILLKFFKTGKGQYGEGDIFLGIKVPEQRKIAEKYSSITLDDIGQLLKSNIHEFRLTSLLILVLKYKKEDFNRKKEIVDFYLSNMENINNWDLVDSSAPYILGDFLLDKDIAEILLLDKHDLIHKAVGWMLREIGKRDDRIEEEFLGKHYRRMPRTMLRYAIENFDDDKRKFYLSR
ncbi:MAG: DNA alkylation repair protein [Candidatus Methanoperedens sp.]|nr:DNA alkylation repair protein [Candidatus Methanoperedens sp.]